MSVQRYDIPTTFVSTNDPDGPWVLYADHVAALAEAETRGYVAGVERENRSFGFAYQQGRAEALREVIGDLDARIDREVAEKDGDGLLDGLRYARDCITAMKGAIKEASDE